jgi:hypothetical protein
MPYKTYSWIIIWFFENYGQKIQKMVKNDFWTNFFLHICNLHQKLQILTKLKKKSDKNEQN